MALQYRSFEISTDLYGLPCANPHVSELTALPVQNPFLSLRSSDTVVRLRQEEIGNTEPNCTAIQLWEKNSTQQESLNRTTDRPHNQLHAWYAGKGRARSNYKGSSTKIDPTTASDLGSNPSDGSAMETQASSFLVFGRKDILPDPLFRIPRKQYRVCLMLSCLIDQS